MATYASTYGNPDWYRQNINPQDAQSQANRLGISTDQLFQLYAQTNMPNIGQSGQQGGAQGSGQQWTIPSGGLRPTQAQMVQFGMGQGGPQIPGANQLIAAPPSASGTALSGIYGPMATWQNVTGQGGQPASGTSGLAQFAQLSPQQFQFQVPQQIVPKPVAGQTVVPAAQPGAQPVVPPKQYQGGGFVTNQLSPAQIQSLKSQGYSDQQIQQLQGQQLSSTDWSSLGLGLSGGQQIQPTVGATGTGGTPTPQQQLGGREAAAGGTTGALVRMILNQQGGQQNQGPPTPGNAYGKAYPLYAQDAQGNPTGQPFYANPTMQLGLLGAAATESNPIINLPPSGTPSAKSGVAPTGGALIGSTVPSTGGWTWNSLTQTYGLTPADISVFQAQGLNAQQAGAKLNATWNPVTEKASIAAGYRPEDIAAFKAQGMTPQQVTAKFGVQAGLPTPTATPGMTGPWTEQPGVFRQATAVAPTVAAGATPLQAAAQPTAIGYNPTATPFAQAPPAPGVQIPAPLMMAHTSGLADAGKAIFAHFGGDPNSATPEAIANFHSQLTGALGGAFTAGPNPANPLLGATMTPPAGGMPSPQPWLTSSRPPPPGMPATPAEGISALSGVMGPTNTAAALAGLQGGAPPPPPKKMQRGGVVPGRGNEDTVPALLTPGEYVIPRPQVQQLMRTGRLPLKMANGGTVPDNDPNAPPETRRKPLTTAAQTQSTPPPAAPGGGYSGSSLVPALATAAHAYGSSMANLPRNPIGTGSGVDIRNTALDPDPDLPSLKAAGMLGGGGMSSGMKSALGGIGSGLSQAAQAIASSVQPWQMQQNAIPAPPPAPAAPQFTQQQIPQQTPQGTNPYAAYAMNQARYPTSPYYT